MTLLAPKLHQTGSATATSKAAAAFLRQHLAQVKQAERIANEATEPIRDAWESIIGIVARQPSSMADTEQRVREILKRAMRLTHGRIENDLRDLIDDAHTDASEAWLRLIPRETWLRLAMHKTGQREWIELHEGPKSFFSKLLGYAIDFGKLLTGQDLPKREFDSLVKKTVFPPPPEQKVEQILRGDSWPDRKTWPQRLAQEGFSFDKITSQISSGMAQGQAVAELTEQVRPLVNNVYYRAARIARTEATRVSQTMQRESWEPVTDLIIGGQIHNPLDERTRPEHRERAGTKYYKPGYGPPGGPSYAEMPNTPDAPNCRCATTPLILGVDE